MIPPELYADIIDAFITNKPSNNRYSDFIQEFDGEIKFDVVYETVTFCQRFCFDIHITFEILHRYLRECLDRAIERSYEKDKTPCLIIIDVSSENSLINAYLISSDVNDYDLEEIANEIVNKLTNLLLKCATSNKEMFIQDGPLEIRIVICKSIFYN